MAVMINSFRRMRTGKRTGDGEADGGRGSGRKRRQLFGLFGCSGGGGSLPPHGQRRAERSPHRHPVRRIGERSEAPPQQEPAAAGASSFLFLVLLFLRLSPVGGSGWKPSHRRRQNPPSCAAKTAAGGSAGRAPAARRQNPPHTARSSSPAARRQNPPHTARSSSPAARRQSPPALQDVVQLDTAAGMRLFSALQETNPPPRPQGGVVQVAQHCSRILFFAAKRLRRLRLEPPQKGAIC